HHRCQHQIESGACRRPRDQPDVRITALDSGGEADCGAHQHHALDPEIDDPGALADDLAKRGVKNGGRECKRDRDDAADRRAAHALLPYARASSTVIISVAASTLTIADGRPWVI